MSSQSRLKHIALVAVLVAAAAVLAPPAFAARDGIVCVGRGSGCEPDLAAALAAAHDGDVIHLAPGDYSGGVMIDKSVTIIGAGPKVTVVRGGGPVLTIGEFGAATEPTVTLSGITVRGGTTRGSFVGDHAALGGGILIPPAKNFALGATVVIDGSVIEGNRVSPAAGVDAGFSCGSHDCEFGLAAGAGIDSWGALRLNRTAVLDNVADGAFASDADGAGVNAHEGSLSIEHSRIENNRATTTAPNGRFAEGGGIMVDSTFSGQGRSHCCTFSVQDSIVSSNLAHMSGSVPVRDADGSVIDTNANGGGIHIGDGIPATVTTTAITRNDVRADDLSGEPYGIDAGMLVADSPLTMSDSSVSDNRVETSATTSVDIGPGGSALELNGGGTITRSTIRHNTATAFSPSGAAQENGGLAVLTFNNDPKLVTLSHSVIDGNVTKAISHTGSATVQGGAIFNNSLLAVTDSRIVHNIAIAHAPTGQAQGGGIWNGVELSGPPVTLSLRNSEITHNALVANPGITRAGGGLFSTGQVTLTITTTRIAHNAPDQCQGC